MRTSFAGCQQTALSWAAGVLTACLPIATQPSAPIGSVPQEEKHVTRPVRVDSVEILRLQTYPAQIQIVVHGEKAVGIDIDVEQERRDREVFVRMTQTYPDGREPERVPFERSVHLKGGFPPGDYLLRVNDYSTRLTI